jgi:tetratricopeptide (TPR) repeat protein
MTCRLVGAFALFPVLLVLQGGGAVFAAGTSDPSQFPPPPEQGSAASAGQPDCNARNSPDQRIAACTRVIEGRAETAANRAIAYVNRGIAYKSKLDFERALADFDEAIKLDPGQPAAYENRALIHYSNKDLIAPLRISARL